MEQESERVSYMTYAMKIQEERDEARAEYFFGCENRFYF